MTRHDSPRVVVVGAGALGVATATELARQGAEVVLVSEHGLADGASGRSLAWLNSYGPRSTAYHQLRLLGIDRYRTFGTTTDAASYLRFGGGLTWAAAGEEEGHREAYAHMHANGYAARWITRDDVPALAPGVDLAAVPDAGAIFNPQEGWVDLPSLVTELSGRFVAAGGTIQDRAGHCSLLLNAGRVTGVRTGDGRTENADAVVLATGAQVPGTLAELGVTVPDATPIALLVRTPAIDTPLTTVLNTPRVAVRPTPTGALVLDSAWSEEEVEVRPDGTYLVHDETIRGLLKEASAVLAGNPELECESTGVGPKPIPCDGEPVLGGVDEIDGLHVAFTHSGATLALIAGELIADEIVRGTPHPLLDPFRPSRFARAGA